MESNLLLCGRGFKPRQRLVLVTWWGLDGDSAQDEFREQAISALLQIASVRQLGNQVGGADKMADDAVPGIVQLDFVEIDFITGEVDDRESRRERNLQGRCAADNGREQWRREIRERA